MSEWGWPLGYEISLLHHFILLDICGKCFHNKHVHYWMCSRSEDLKKYPPGVSERSRSKGLDGWTWGHSNLDTWLPKSNQFVHECKWLLCQTGGNSSTAFLGKWTGRMNWRPTNTFKVICVVLHCIYPKQSSYFNTGKIPKHTTRTLAQVQPRQG